MARAGEQTNMTAVQYRVVNGFAEPEFSEAQREAFAGLELPSLELARLVESEAALGPAPGSAVPRMNEFRLGAYEQDRLVGWTYGWMDGSRSFYMSASGVRPSARRQGIYSQLVSRVIDHCRQRGCTSVHSRHIALNNPVLIAKLKLGFFIAGYSYSEALGPIVHLKCVLTEQRLALLRLRAAPLRPATGGA